MNEMNKKLTRQSSVFILDYWLGPGGIARPFSTQIISVNRDVKQISVGFKKVTVEASEMTVGYMTV